MIKKTLVFGATALMICSSLNAAELSYSNIGLSYLSQDGADGIGLVASIELNENIFLLGGLAHTQADVTLNGATLDLYNRNLGVGFHSPINETTDFVMSLEYLEVEIDDFFGDTSKGDGYGLRPGIRSKISEAVELNVGIFHANLEGASETGLTLGAAVNVSSNLALNVNYVNIDDADAIALGLRVEF